MPFVPPEPKWLFSNRNYWYPQNQVTDYATASVRLTVPSEYHVVSSGILDAGLAGGRGRGDRLKAPRASFRACPTRSPRRNRCATSPCWSAGCRASMPPRWRSTSTSRRPTRRTCAARRRCSNRSARLHAIADDHATGRRPQHHAAVGGREQATGSAQAETRSSPPRRSCGCIQVCSATRRTAR